MSNAGRRLMHAAKLAATLPRESETRSAMRSGATQPLPVLVKVAQSGHFQRCFRLERGTCVVVAGPTADLVIDDDTVSRAHARLEVVPEGVVVEHLRSGNGTFYLGQRFSV